MASEARQTGPLYWRSLDELADTPEFRRWVAAEFPSLASALETGRGAAGYSRRQFLHLMGASLALAGLTACRWPKETIVPATKQPSDRVPGVPVQYATAMEIAGVATGLLVTSYDGRPIKIEGNDKHPFSRGRTNHWMQASILDLYDPDRSQNPRLCPQPHQSSQRLNRTWEEFAAWAGPHFGGLRAQQGAGLALLTEASSSPTLADIRARFLAVFPQAQWYEYEPLARDHEREGTRLALGQPCRPQLQLDQADVIVSFDSDFLMLHPAAVRYAADFAARRRADDGTMNRLYVFESNLTVTGSMADHRYAVPSSQARRILEHLAAAVADALGLQAGAAIARPTGPIPLNPAAVSGIATDLLAHKGRCLVIAGPRQPAEVHAAVCVLNAWLKAVGHTITYTQEPDADRPPHVVTIAKLAEQMKAGAVITLVILGGNPVYNAPADLRFAEALAQVPNSIRLSLYGDETSQPCTWHLPQAHYLEAWGDARAWDGTVSIVQPLIAPLYNGRTAIELLALLAGDDITTGYDLVRRTFRQTGLCGAGGGEAEFETAWNHALHDGLVPDSAWPTQAPTLTGQRIPEYSAGDGWEVVFAADYSLYDGRFANNAWLQEWPDPITKLTWDNAALISPTDAERLGATRSGDNLFIALGAPDSNTHLTIPAFILPGHAAGSITLPLGYARPHGGVVAKGAGFDSFRLRTTADMDWVIARDVSRKSGSCELATTQDHHAIRSNVGDAETQARIPVLIREATLKQYQEQPDFAQHVVHLPVLKSLWQEKEYKDHKWGMAIDLSACIGCGACVLACQAENNVPVVGKDEVARGREMHWLRVDRYFREEDQGSRDQGHNGQDPGALPSGSPGPQLQVVHQPVACIHCELAPCEEVCPVAATVHDEEGLNVMVYNRCIGTRYCSNNCPFKVRRFNWFYNHHGPRHPRSLRAASEGDRSVPGLLTHAELTDIEKMVNNPNVTVRSRGVMEKCSFCVQRIAAVKIKAKNERWDRIPDGLIVPACAQACPTDAIVFGDLNDPDSRVRRLHDHNRAYALLAELNLKPRTKYLAKLTNPAEAG